MFDIELTQEAKKDLKKFEKRVARVILKKIYSIRKNPLHYIERLVGLTLWKLRIGDYRAVILLNTKEKKIKVIKIGHRKKIYKQLRK